MKSVAQKHYPRYVFRDDSKLLWNPILKKTFVNRPEERVRLQVLDYLILEAGFSSSRISFESPVHLPKDKSASRTDVICFDKEFNPFLLIECKAPVIKLDEKASIQIARYNQQVEAPYLLITNGNEDFWFLSDDDKIKTCKDIPIEFTSKNSFKTDFEYWCERGFAGKKSHPNTRNWIAESCEFLYSSSKKPFPTYLNFEGSSPEFYMSNYYRIIEKNDSLKLAISLTGTPFGATKLNCVLNKKGVNNALLSCSLDLLANGDSKNTIMQSAAGTSHINLIEEIGVSFDQPINTFISSLLDLLNKNG